MPLITCKDCGKEFSDAAAACPHCGRPAPVPLMKKKFGCGGCLVVLLIGFIAVIATNTPSAPTAANLTAQENGNLQYEAEQSVRATLKDPKSATFRNVLVVRKAGSTAVCGEVNAKNSFGGYTGFKQFMARGGVAMIRAPESDRQFVKLWNRACVS